MSVILDQRVQPGRCVMLRPRRPVRWPVVPRAVGTGARGRRVRRRRRRRHPGDDVQLHELPLDERAEMRDVDALGALQRVQVARDAARLGVRGTDDPLPLRLRLADDELRLALGRLAGLGAELLRGDQRLAQRLVPLAERAELLVEVARLLLEVLVHARQPLHLLGHALLELVDRLLLVAAHRRLEGPASDLDRRQIHPFVAHADLAPNSAVPMRTRVAPSSTAISKSFVMPIDSSVAGCPTSASTSRAARAAAKVGRSTRSSSVNCAIVITPLTRRPTSPVSRSPSARRSSGEKPPLVASPAGFTCTSTSTARPRSTPMRSIASARRALSSECTRAKRSTCFALLR